MRLPRVRFTIRWLMIAVLIISLLLALEAHRERLRRRAAAMRAAQVAAKAAYINTRMTREVAEIALAEYVRGVYRIDIKSIEAEIALAKSDLARASDRVEWAQRMFDEGLLPQAQTVAEEQALEKCKFALEQAQARMKVLVNERDKTIKELQSEVEKSRADELVKKATLDSYRRPGRG